MILSALVEYYETLAAQGKIAQSGWADVKVSYALEIGDNGELKRVVNIKTEQQRGKKTVLVPQVMNLPAPVKRSSGILPNFLCDNSSYLLGIDTKGKPERSRDCFLACKELHEKLLSQLDCPAANAILKFFSGWNPETASKHPALQEEYDEIVGGANLIFRTTSGYVQDDILIADAWNSAYGESDEDMDGFCMVTGKKGPVEKIHPSIKNVAGAQSSGAALVSFNAPSLCSYGKEQNFNAPTGKYAAFAYTTALNHLLADRERVFRVGDTTIVCWAKNGSDAYQDFFSCSLMETSQKYTPADIYKMVQALCRGETIDFENTLLDSNMDFYILGLSPNAARISVRFFCHNTFGGFLNNILMHQQRLEIVRPSFDKFEVLPLWKLLSETVNQKSKDKAAAPNMAGETLRAILNNTPYPATLLNGVVLRIRAEKEVTRGRAAIIKAYYLKQPNQAVPKEEVLTVALNPESKNIPYTLGRMFAVLEAIQSDANPGINSTIRDRYFNSASATPAVIFPTLLNLAQKHLKKIKNEGRKIYYNKLLTELLSILEETYPNRLSLPEQGSFQLGYYHQAQDRYTKKEEK